MSFPSGRKLATLSLLVPDYDEGIRHYTEDLGFVLLEDVALAPGKRWVVIATHRGAETNILLAQAKNEQEAAAVGNQAGGRVFLFLQTDDFERDHARFLARGIRFLETPRREVYGVVAVFQDKFGNKWDLIQRFV